MEWFIEKYNGLALMIQIKKRLVKKESKFQKIEIYNTTDFGKMLVLDGKIQLTERDEAFYHEMLVHVPMFSHKNPKKILVIGGGDGASVREVIKHNPDEIFLVEIDRDVIELSKKYLKVDKGALDDKRTKIIIEDGYNFLKETKEKFDVIIVDGTDPNRYSERIIKHEFYRICNKKCEIFATQSQSPFQQKDYFISMIKEIKKSFDFFKPYIGFVPSYPSGLWSYIIAKYVELDLEVLKKRFNERDVKTCYYKPELHVACFELPRWLEELSKSSYQLR